MPCPYLTEGDVPVHTAHEASMRTFLTCALIVMCVAPVRSQAVELHPSDQQVATALERGRTAATARTPPVELYSWFGPPRDDANEFRPRGFLKIGRASCRERV